MIDPLLDRTIRHSVNQAQYSNWVVAKMIHILNLSDTDLMAQLSIALADVDASTFKVQRLNSLLESVRELNADAYAAMYGGLTGELEAYVAHEGHFQYDLYKSVVPVTFEIATVVPEQVYAAAMSQPMQGRLLKDWSSSLSQGRLQRIKDTVAIGYTEGKTTSQIVRELRGTKQAGYADGLLNTDRRHVESIVRTALSHTAQTTRNRFYDANADILGNEIWVSTLDGRTSQQCRVRDGLKYTPAHQPVDHKVPYLAGPGRLHFCCRSTSIALLKGQKSLTGTRSSADGKVDANLTYNDWLQQQSATVQDEVLGKARGEMYRAGRLDQSSFSNERGIQVSLKELKARDARMFKQPSGQFTIYDPGYARVAPDVSTPARAAAVKLEEQIRRDDLETGAVFAKDGKLLVQRQGAKDSVEFTRRDFELMRGNLFTHNHPNDGTFSPNDMRLASKHDIGELRAVGPTARYIMSAPDGWPTIAQLYDAKAQFGPLVQNKIDVMIEAGELRIPNAAAEIDHQFWIMVAKAYKLKYTREAS